MWYNGAMDTLINATTRQELRDWLTLHTATAKEAWVPCAIKSKPGKIAYLDIVEEALCFGWIDSTKKGSGDAHIQRISPRSKKSHWTELNKERVRRLKLPSVVNAAEAGAAKPTLRAPGHAAWLAHQR